MANEDVILVNIIDLAVKSMSIYANFEPGRQAQIMKSISDFDNSISLKGEKYPLIAMILPVREVRGSALYGKAKIPRITIATLTSSGDGTEPVLPRFKDVGTFKNILYPLYYEFLRQLGRSAYIIGSDPNMFIHEKMDNPGQHPIGEGTTDYIDSIDILNLELILNQIKIC